MDLCVRESLNYIIKTFIITRYLSEQVCGGLSSPRDWILRYIRTYFVTNCCVVLPGVCECATRRQQTIEANERLDGATEGQSYRRFRWRRSHATNATQVTSALVSSSILQSQLFSSHCQTSFSCNNIVIGCCIFFIEILCFNRTTESKT